MTSDVFFSETDETGVETIYVKSNDDKLSITKLESSNTVNTICSNILTVVKDIFLPQGFPDSVHPDYIPYQIWDTVQAFASTIMGALTTHSIMKGIGVGDTNAPPLAAAITWILKDGTGMIGRIAFAWLNGTDLDRQCKKWRLFADILNDAAMGIELLVPYFSTYSMGLLCVSTAMKSVVGVAGGATRAALTQHQALQNNLADVSAKDGSQETCVNLIASFVGIFILSLFHDGRYLMELYLILVAVHLYANYSAVKELRLNSFNEDRLSLAVKHYLLKERVPDPEAINKAESVMLFQRPTKDICGFNIRMGTSLAKIMQRNIVSSAEAAQLLTLNDKYLVIADTKQRTIFVCFAKNAQSSDTAKAYFHACLCGLFLCMSSKLPIEYLLKAESCELSRPLTRIYVLARKYSYNTAQQSNAVEAVRATNLIVDREYEAFIYGAKNNGWVIGSNLLPVGVYRLSWKRNDPSL